MTPMGLDDALREARGVRDDKNATEAQRRKEKIDLRERQLQLRLEAIGYLAELGSDLFVQVDTDDACQYTAAFRNADRFEGPQGQVWRVVDEEPCWIADDKSSDVADPILLLADGRVGRLIPHPLVLTRLDPRRDGHRGREVMSRMPLGEGPRWPLTEQLLAHMILRYERARDVRQSAAGRPTGDGSSS